MTGKEQAGFMFDSEGPPLRSKHGIIFALVFILLFGGAVALFNVVTVPAEYAFLVGVIVGKPITALYQVLGEMHRQDGDLTDCPYCGERLE